MGGACGCYGAEEKCVQSFDGDTEEEATLKATCRYKVYWCGAEN